MKNIRHISAVFPILVALLFALPTENLSAQTAKKNRVRLKVNYTKVMNAPGYLDIGAVARIEKQMTEIPNLDLEVYYEYEEEEVSLGTTRTNMSGKSIFVLPSLETIKSDSTETYTLGVSFGGNDYFNKASRSVSFKDADINTELITEDSTNYIKATLTDAVTKIPLAENSLTVQVKRLINPLVVGEEFNYTDENGTIFVPVEAGIPGLDGILTLEVVLPDSDDYGTVKAVVEAPYGVPIVEDTSFDERSLWGPRNRTPIFILFFTFFLIAVTWGPIAYLIRNLYKISKS
jgi:hypothetical protein